MTNISNIFYWDIKTNKKVSLTDVDKIKTSNLVKCKIKEDRIYIAPFDETDSKLDENKTWKILDEIKEKYKKIDQFIVKYNSNKKWKWHDFYKKGNDIEMVMKEDIEASDNVGNTENPIDDSNEINDDTYIYPTDTLSLDDLISNKENIENNMIDITNINKIDEKNKIIINFMNNKLPKMIKDPDKVQKIKEKITSYKNDEEAYNSILSYFEDMGEISENDINKLLNLDKSSDINLGTVSYNKGMGAFFKVQSIVNDGSIKKVNEMYEDIWNNLKNIYNNNYNNSSKNEQKNLNKISIFESEENYDLAKLSIIYAKFLKNWASNNGSVDVKGSADFRNNMTSYFPEVLTPFTILWGENGNNASCLDEKGHKAIEMLKNKVGIDSFETSLISFPQSDYQPLFDSVLYFPSSDNSSKKSIRLSTKGGKNGLGAQASISGLLTYFYKMDMLPQNIFTKKFWSLNASDYTNAYQDYMYAFAMKPENEFALKILSAFMLSSSNQYHRIVNILFEIIKQDEKYNKEFQEKLNFYENTTDKRIKKPAMSETLKTRIKGLIIQKYINDHKEFQDCVLAALKYASFDFAQVNYKETGNDGDDFHYEIFVQYPAIFDGEIRFELMQGLKFHKLKFHILGSNIEH